MCNVGIVIAPLSLVLVVVLVLESKKEIAARLQAEEEELGIYQLEFLFRATDMFVELSDSPRAKRRCVGALQLLMCVTKARRK